MESAPFVRPAWKPTAMRLPTDVPSALAQRTLTLGLDATAASSMTFTTSSFRQQLSPVFWLPLCLATLSPLAAFEIGAAAELLT